MTQKPGLAQHTRIPNLRDPVPFNGDADVIAVTAAKRANNVINLHIFSEEKPLRLENSKNPYLNMF